MLYSIPKTKMLSAAQNSLSPFSKPRSMLAELLFFLIVAMIGGTAITLAQSVFTTSIMFFDSEYYGVVEQMTQDGSFDSQVLAMYIEAFMANLPDYAHIFFVASTALYVPAAIIYCKRFEKRKPFSMGFNKRGVMPEYLMGILVGAVMIAIPAAICYVTGCVTFSFGSSSPLMIVLFFVAFVLQGMGEEVFFRGYLLTSLTRRNHEWVAIIISSVVFSIFHLPNAGFNVIAFVNITLFGVFAAVFMLKRGSIWAVSAIHTAWNFIQGNILGIRVSGNPKFASVFNSVNAEFGSVLNGGEFGLEGGLGVTAVLLLALLFTLMMPAKKSEIDNSQILF